MASSNYVTYLMECKHQQVMDLLELAEYKRCDTCRRDRKVIAVECREWKYSCARSNCRVARFTGASMQEANDGANRHYAKTHHLPINIDFLRVEWKVLRVRRFYGPRFRTWIIDRNKLEGAKRYDPKPLLLNAPAMEDTEEVPF